MDRLDHPNIASLLCEPEMSYSVNSRFYAMLFPILSSIKPDPGFQLGSTNVVVWRHQWSKSRANQEWFFKCCPDTLMKLRMTEERSDDDQGGGRVPIYSQSEKN